MKRRQEWLERMRRVEREYLAAVSARELLKLHTDTDPNWGLPYGWSASDARSMSHHLEDTYLVRLYAEFESGLRDAWRNYHRRRSRVPMEQLLVRIATLHRAPPAWEDQADEVRRYRNSVVHELGGQNAAAFELIDRGRRLSEATSRLCRFFSLLPIDW